MTIVAPFSCETFESNASLTMIAVRVEEPPRRPVYPAGQKHGLRHPPGIRGASKKSIHYTPIAAQTGKYMKKAGSGPAFLTGS
jgi:hypothetical protein